MYHIFSILGLLLIATSIQASTLWVRMEPQDTQCALTCSRDGLENVITPENQKVSGASVCATSLAKEFIPGTNFNRNRELSTRCQINVKQSATGQQRSVDYCLCADDGLPNGHDYTWSKHKIGAKSCRDTCANVAPKYSFAVYASQIENNWLHVCALQSGHIGFVEPSAVTCRTPEVKGQNFGCLCTQTFAGDLDMVTDP